MMITMLTVCVLAGAAVTMPEAHGVESRCVLSLPAKKNLPRNGEGDLLRLKDGRIFFAYTEYWGGSTLDNAPAHTVSRVSKDDGETWSDTRELFPREGKQNDMSISLLRMKDGRIALFNLRKNSDADCTPYVRYSSDEGETWTAPQRILPEAATDYYCVNNARVERLSTGRMLVPMAKHSLKAGAARFNGVISCAYSDDEGKTWKQGREYPVADAKGAAVDAQEPGVIELKDGRVYLYARTGRGCQYQAFSADGGETWTDWGPAPIFGPRGPATIRRLKNGDLFLVWNDHEGLAKEKTVDGLFGGRRSPVTIAISKDEGKTWIERRTVEPWKKDGFSCYFATLFLEDGSLLLHYYNRWWLNDSCIMKIKLPGGADKTAASAARPRIWWHWENGRVDEAEMIRDIEAIAAAGFGGFTPIDIGWAGPTGDVAFAGEKWFDRLAAAERTAKRLGLEMTLPNCSGFSSSGGPWVKPEQSMKFLEWTETAVRGGGSRVVLPRPVAPIGFYRDVAVFAVPRAPVTKEPDDPFTVRGLAFDLAFAGFIYQGDGEVVAETSADGKTFVKSAAVPIRLARTGLPYDGRRFVALPAPLRAKAWRVSVRGVSPHVPAMKISNLEYLSEARLPEARAKSLRVRLCGDYSQLPDGAAALPRERVVDLTGKMKADGSLEWEAPEGDWTVVRLGYSANGRKNHPATPSGTGLEVDKLDAAAVEAHFDAYAGKVMDRVGAGSAITGLLVDSYEMRSQNWTENLPREFERRTGYALKPWYPALAGFPLVSAAETEKFLKDYRRVIGELFTENYAGTLARKCREKGLAFTLEPYGTAPADNFEYGLAADVPMSECWIGNPVDNGDFAASVAHVKGARIVEAEAFTSMGGAPHDFKTLKAVADAAYAKGVNRLVFHRYVHQPYPGAKRLSPWGTEFDRTNDWWGEVPRIVEYCTRTQAELQRGEPVVDLLFVEKDDVPNEGGNTKGAMDPPRKAPAGWKADHCSWKTYAKGGVAGRYRVVVLPGEKAPTAAELIAKGCLPEVKADAAFEYVHRRDAGTEIYFIVSREKTEKEIEFTFRARGEPVRRRLRLAPGESQILRLP